MGRKTVTRVAFFVFLWVLFPVFCSHGGEHIVLYRLGVKDPVPWEQLRTFLGKKGYRVTEYDGTESIEKHVEHVNKINQLKASVFLALDFGYGEKKRVVVAVTTPRKGRGNILAIDEVPALHANESRELATSLAQVFDKGVKEIPLFPVLGVDMPAVLLKIACAGGNASEMMEKLHEGLGRYFKRGINK